MNQDGAAGFTGQANTSTVHAGPLAIDLVTRARSGDKRSWDVLVERYAPLIWSICRRYRWQACRPVSGVPTSPRSSAGSPAWPRTRARPRKTMTCPQAEPSTRALGESLAALAAQVAALCSQVMQVNGRLDRAGLRGELDLAARFEELAQTVADALDAAAPRGPAVPCWIGLDREAGGSPAPCGASPPSPGHASRNAPCAAASGDRRKELSSGREVTDISGMRAHVLDDGVGVSCLGVQVGVRVVFGRAPEPVTLVPDGPAGMISEEAGD